MAKRRNKPKTRRKAPTAITIRYPPNATIDALLGTMMAERGNDLDTDVIHFWGFASTDHPANQEAAHTAIVLDPDAQRSPVLDAAEWLIRRFHRRLWGFGLAYRTIGEMFTDPGGVPHDAIQAATTGTLHERAGADDMYAATIFDARGFTHTSLTYAHLPELGPTPTSVNDTRDNTDAWIELFDRRVVAAHAWAAAITLDPETNHAAIARLRTP
ncbi:hypothetical protein [Nocardia pneumoniae]|uniref:hypothetical protein n=1 Tax=Nocardia pneumoniae TaxID=228601 RepID=UPI0002F0573D|nr:hypothetical protein [Nocardia pneumoniae]